nr:ParB/RepB/Spo0J family partition protein [Pedobacter sp. ASV19]
MTTIAKGRIGRTNSRNIKPNIEKALKPLNTEGTLKEINIAQIDISPLNYRRVFLKKDLEEFAHELSLHGVISSLMVRKMPSGRFELVVGERRYRAAKIAKLKTVPTIIRILTDDEVREIQLAENMKRENPHPLYESQQVAILQQGGKTIDEIAARLQKSKSWVYTRIKLSELIVGIQEVFLANKISIHEASEIALLSSESQQEFFDTYCTDWEEECFRLNNLKYYLSRLKYDLKKAPFNIKDKNLVPSAGACSHCPFNSATRVSLFPELAKEAVCSHKPCYKNKCTAHAEASIRKAMKQNKIDALLCAANISDEHRMIIDSLPELNALPEYNINEITLIEPPTQPDKEDFSDLYDEDAEDTVAFDEEGYQQALKEYQIDLANYTERLSNPETPKGLAVRNDTVTVVLFSLDKKATYSGEGTVTAKQVQEAIKEGTATVALLEKEIQRLKDREQRAKEIDRDKIQVQVHRKFKELVGSFPELKEDLTAADQVALRLIVFQALDYRSKDYVTQYLLPGVDFYGNTDKEAAYNALAGLSNEQFCFLIREVLVGDSQSQYPGNISGYALYQCAEASGIDVDSINKAQEEKAILRAESMEARIKAIENRIKKMKPAA